MAPAAMREVWDELHLTIGAYMLTQSGLQFLLDAFVAYRFAEALGAKTVWLWPETRPDFAMELSEKRQRFEVTEADWKNRRRGDEYKNKTIPERLAGTEKVEYAPELFAMEGDDAFEMLSRVAVEKSDGRYEKADGLVVFLQPGSWSDERPKVEMVMHKATEVAKDHFAEVWVLWGGRLYELWNGGKKSERRLNVRTRSEEDDVDE